MRRSSRFKSHAQRSLLCAVAATVAALAVFTGGASASGPGATFSGTALAANQVGAARAQGLYYASFRQQEPIINTIAAAQAQGQYYASFGHEKPLTPPPATSSGPPLVLPVIGLAIALLIAAAVTVEFRRRGGRRRAARVPTSV